MPTVSAPQQKAIKYNSKKIGEKETQQILALSQGGFYIDEIAEMTGRTPEQIDTALWNEGYVARAHKYEQAEVAKWVAMYTGQHDGMPMCFAEVARQTGYSTGTIQLAVLRAGVRDRHPSESRSLAHARRRATRKH